MKKNWLHIIGLFTLLLSANALATNHSDNRWLAPLLQNHLLVGKIYSFEQQQFINEAGLLSELQKTPFVLIGEKHDNSDHHRLEKKILTSLISKQHTNVVFEMLTDQQQPLINTLTSSDTLEQMQQKLEWNDKGWPWEDYGPLINVAVQHNAIITAGNISKSIVHKLYQHQNADQQLSTSRFDTIKSIPESVKEVTLNQVYESHCASMPKDKLIPMVDIQLARDASMANAMIVGASANKEPLPSILIAGGFHTQKNMGVPLHLSQLTDQPLKTVLLVEVIDNRLLPEEYATSLQADYLWFTPKQSDIDYCASLRNKPTS